MKNKVSGSLEELIESSTDEDVDISVDLLEKIFNNDVFNLLLEQDMSRKEYSLKRPPEGFVDHWFYSPDLKQMVRIKNSVTVEIISDYDEEKYICSKYGKTFLVPKDCIEEEITN